MHFLEQKLANDARSFDGQEADRLFVRQSRAGAQNVLDQLGGGVVFTFVNDAALRPKCVAVFRIGGFRDQEDFDPRAREAEGRC